MKKDAQETAGKEEEVQKDLQQSQDQNAEAQASEKEEKKEETPEEKIALLRKALAEMEDKLI